MMKAAAVMCMSRKQSARDAFIFAGKYGLRGVQRQVLHGMVNQRECVCEKFVLCNTCGDWSNMLRECKLDAIFKADRKLFHRIKVAAMSTQHDCSWIGECVGE